ncbi:hypothetical protein Aoki45_04490 [Algoriphagus sp. oki45]|nr:hypothetical protein Aoki45_04490 [Algoriphagus sp. oki45]
MQKIDFQIINSLRGLEGIAGYNLKVYLMNKLFKEIPDGLDVGRV